MDPDTEIVLDCSPLFLQYKSGRIERLIGTTTIPPSTDPITGVTTKDIIIPTSGLSARLYLPPSPPSKQKHPILIYIHGGAFCTGSASNPNPFLTSIVAASPLIAVSLDYRLAPEHSLPAAYDDCWAALQWLVSGGSSLGEPAESWLAEAGDHSRMFLMGESAGANIAHYMAMKAGKGGEIKFEGVVLGHPYFWGREAVGAETRVESVRGRVEGLWRLVGLEVEDERVNPMVVEEVEKTVKEGFGRVMVWVAENDVLAERGKAYGEWLKRVVGVEEVEVVESEGEDHVFFYMKPECEKALVLLNKMVAFVNKRRTSSSRGCQAIKAGKIDNAKAHLPSNSYEFGKRDLQTKMTLNKCNYQRPILTPKFSLVPKNIRMISTIQPCLQFRLFR